MIDIVAVNQALLVLGLLLLGFTEPCSIGTTLLIVKAMEGKSSASKLMDILVFAVTRALFFGVLGLLAAFSGPAYFTYWPMFWSAPLIVWIVLGVFYISIGAIIASGRAASLTVSLGPRCSWLSDWRGFVGLGVLFGLNMPVVGVPFLFAFLSDAAGHAAYRAHGGTPALACVSLAILGLALSVPLVALVFFARSRWLDWVASLSRRSPLWTGLLFTCLGASSIWLTLHIAHKGTWSNRSIWLALLS